MTTPEKPFNLHGMPIPALLKWLNTQKPFRGEPFYYADHTEAPTPLPGLFRIGDARYTDSLEFMTALFVSYGWHQDNGREVSTKLLAAMPNMFSYEMMVDLYYIIWQQMADPRMNEGDVVDTVVALLIYIARF